MANPVRSFIENLTRDWSFRRRLPAAFGRAPIVVSPSGGLRYLLRPISRVDPELLASVTEIVRPGDCVWDIGANLGLFSVSAAQVVGTLGSVVAVEPDVWLVNSLRKSARLQKDDAARITVVPAAVSNEVALKTFCIARRSRSANFLAGFGSTQTGGTREEQTVLSITLDWLLEKTSAPAVIKIDVEGAELDVLNGGRATIGKARPLILCEVSKARMSEVGRFFKEQGYSVCDATLAVTARKTESEAPWSTLAIPSEKLEQGMLTRAKVLK